MEATCPEPDCPVEASKATCDEFCPKPTEETCNEICLGKNTEPEAPEESTEKPMQKVADSENPAVQTDSWWIPSWGSALKIGEENQIKLSRPDGKEYQYFTVNPMNAAELNTRVDSP